MRDKSFMHCKSKNEMREGKSLNKRGEREREGGGGRDGLREREREKGGIRYHWKLTRLTCLAV